MESIHLFYVALLESDLSLWFSVSMGFFFIIVSLAMIFPKFSEIYFFKCFYIIYRRNPNILMNVGIFGTFSGICVALLYFDATDIDASVPGLLSGMKLAFATSVLGVGLSIFLHLLDSAGKGGKPDAGTSPVEALIGEMHQSRKAIVEELTRVVENGDEAARLQAERSAHMIETLEKLHQSLVGDDDASLATRLLHMRQDANDGRKNMEKLLTDSFEAIRTELAQFGKTLAESNSKALLEALREVIKDFNTKLTEEFGQNFKELNRAVGELLIWQENYRESVEAMQSQFGRCLEGINRCEESLSSIRDHAESIPGTMETLSDILNGLEQQNTQATTLLESFAHMREQAGEALPVIEKELVAMTEGVSRALGESGQKVTAFAADVAEQMTSAVSEVSEDLEASTKLFVDTLRKSTQKTADDLTQITNKAHQAVNQNAQELQATLDDALRKTRELMNSQFKAFDSAMEKELEKVIGQLGGHLTSLSQKFVDDYTPLTNRLAELIRISEKIDILSRAGSGSGRG